MSFTETVLLGALSGFTIYLGLPFARLRLLGPRAKVALAMFAVGVLAFLFVDVMEHGFEIVEEAVTGLKDGGESLGHVLWLALLLGGGFALGSAGLSILEAWMRRGSSPLTITSNDLRCNVETSVSQSDGTNSACRPMAAASTSTISFS